MLPEDCTLVLSNGRQVVSNSRGDVASTNPHCGVYESDHRLLSGLETTILAEGSPVELESLGQRNDGDEITTTLVTTASGSGRGDVRAFIVEKQLSITNDGLQLAVTLSNNTASDRSVEVRGTAIPDFSHVFELASFFTPRDAPDRPRRVEADVNSLTLSATLADGGTRSVEVLPPEDASVSTDDDAATWTASTEVGAASNVTLTTDVRLPDGTVASPSLDFSETSIGLDSETGQGTQPLSEGELKLARAARRTLDALMLPCGVPAAGAPRFLAPFGRDSLIVSYQLLPFDATVAERTLRFLASEQGQAHDDETLEAPGRILHELRRGDLVSEEESVRRPYFGTVDAASLFVALYTDTVQRAGETELRDELYPAVRSSVQWILDAADDQGFVSYEPHDHRYGLVHQGWKDSADALARPDGTPAEGSVVLPEVQGYTHRALRQFAPVASQQGDDSLADECDEHADRLQTSFEERFWLPEESCYALGIDDRGVIPSVASNQTHAFWGGLGRDDRVRSAVDRLCQPDVLTETGIRTFAGSHDAFDPVSYHRGSVWPHDTAFAAAAFAERGFDSAAETVAERGLGALGEYLEASRPERLGFPELLLGLSGRQRSVGHLKHPDACEPAAWAAGSVFSFLATQYDLLPLNSE